MADQVPLPTGISDLPRDLIHDIIKRMADNTPLRSTCVRMRHLNNEAATSLRWAAGEATPESFTPALFAMCPGIININIMESTITDLSPLAECVGLQSLKCSNTNVANLAPLSACLQLQSLNCRHSYVKDLAPLSA